MLTSRDTTSEERDPILRRLSRARAGMVGYIAAPVMVALATAFLWWLQSMLAAWERIDYVRPYGIAFIVPIVLVALIGGRGPGIVALLLADLALDTMLLEPGQPAFARTPRDWAEMTLLPVVGAIVILGVEAFRHNVTVLGRSRELQARTQALMESAPVGIAVVHPSAKVLFANAEMERIVGQSLAGVPMDGPLSYKVMSETGEPIPFEHRPIARVLHGESETQVRELQIVRSDGSMRWVEHRATAVADDTGGVAGAILITVDMTARREAEMQLRARIQREAVMNRVALAIRSAEGPDAVQRTAAVALAAALNVDRCYFTSYDAEGDTIFIEFEAHREGLPSIAGRYPLSMFADTIDEFFNQGKTLRLADVCGPPLAEKTSAAILAHGIRSLMAVPIFDDNKITTLLVAAMADQPREWSDDEVALAEIVAAQTVTAVEAARLRAKEHRIATTLQDALRPLLPTRAPGIDLAQYYVAALDESSIGGDFLDVFPSDPVSASLKSAIMIGDVSGKGLAAASQVATVRMTARYALTQGGDIAATMRHLNDTLALNDWLIGFATLFAGIYDPRTRTLEYVSCGHEPALLRRAETGEIVALEATGAALGAYAGAEYEAGSVTLEPRDQLLLYTDGVSEAGPSRREALNTEGVARIFSQTPTTASAAELIESVYGALARYSGGVLRDDVCLLAIVAGDE